MLDFMIACLSFPIAVVLGGALLVGTLTRRLESRWWVILIISLSTFAWYGLFRFSGFWMSLTSSLGYGALILAMVLIGIGFIWARSFTVKWPMFILTLAAALGVLTAVPLGYELSDQARTTQNGDLIVQAARNYYADHGSYPATIVKLIPKYLPSWPKIYGKPGWPGYSVDWKYQAEPDRFLLGFEYLKFEDDQEMCVYTSDQNQWSCEFSYWSLLIGIQPQPVWFGPP
jgi:hypothetical protein